MKFIKTIQYIIKQLGKSKPNSLTRRNEVDFNDFTSNKFEVSISKL